MVGAPDTTPVRGSYPTGRRPGVWVSCVREERAGPEVEGKSLTLRVPFKHSVPPSPRPTRYSSVRGGHDRCIKEG